MPANKPFNVPKGQVDIDTLLGVIYGYYTQYVVLKPISNDAFARTRADKLSIFIDLDDIFVHLDRYAKNMSMSNDMIEAITSGLINMCAHYRNFFNNTFGVATYIFMIGNASPNGYVESRLCGEYNHPQLSPTMMVCKNSVMQMLQYISAYIPDIYAIDHGYDFNAMVVSITDQSQFNIETMPGLVISKDETTLLLGAEGLTILRPKKYKGSDLSYMVLPEMAYDIYIATRTNKPIIPHSNDNLMLGVLVSIAGLSQRKIKSSRAINSVASAISKCVSDPNNRVINSSYISDENLLEIIRVLKIKDELTNPILERYHSLCPSISSNAMKMSGDFIKAYNKLVNIYDPEKMKKLNETTFKKYPLDLNAL